jgi:nitrogen fixation protein FixH
MPAASPSLARPAPGGRWIPWLFVAFFGVVLAANGIMLAIALQSWNGLATEHAYQKGLAYNATLEAAARWAALGWRAELTFRQTGPRAGELVLSLEDRAGRPISGAETQGWLVRPTHQGFDQEVVLQARGDGRYRAAVALPLAGQWEARLAVPAGGERHELTRRILVRPEGPQP